MTKILILDIGNGQNKGNLALLYSTMETIEKFVSDVEFVLMYYGDTGSHSNIGLKEQHLIGKIHPRKPKDTAISLFYLLKCAYIHIFNKFGVHIPISKNSRLFEYYDSDIVVEIGGDTMSGENSFGTFTPFMNILYAILLGKPVVLYGESIGYYNNSGINSIAKFVFNRTKLILVREELSKKCLDDNSITNPKIYVTADPAFLLNAVPQLRVFEILSNEGINGIQRPLIGINASKLISRYKGTEHQKDEEEITNIMAKVIDYLIGNLNVNIIMIPHVYEPGNDTDDRIAINNIFHKVENKSKVKIIKNEYTPQELKGIIGQCELFVGARMHATIASTSMLVPTVGIAYSHKMYGIIGKMLGQEKYVLDIKDLSYESLISKINDAWENREKIKKELEIKIPMVKEKAMLNGKFVKDVLEEIKSRGGMK